MVNRRTRRWAGTGAPRRRSKEGKEKAEAMRYHSRAIWMRPGALVLSDGTAIFDWPRGLGCWLCQTMLEDSVLAGLRFGGMLRSGSY